MLNKYEVLQCGDIEKLIKKRRQSEDDILYYVSIEDTYDIIKRAHLATGHCGRDCILKEFERGVSISQSMLYNSSSLTALTAKSAKRREKDQ